MSDVINRLEQHIMDECMSIDREERFDSMLDECYSFEKVGGPFAHMVPSRVLKSEDPTAYRCGVNDYADGEEWVYVGGEYYEQRAAQEALDEFLSELESNVADLEQAIEDAEEDVARLEDGTDPVEWEEQLAKLRALLTDAEDEVNQVNRYSFSS